MRRLLMIVALVCLFAQYSHANESYTGICEQGNTSVVIPGTQGSGSQKFQRSYPSCTVTVYAAGTTTLSTIYSDNAGTALANPFTAAASGRFTFYAANGNYDVRLSGAGIAAPFTIGNIILGGTTQNCASYPGATAGAKIAACIADLPSTGGTADARGITGASQTITSDPFSGVTKPVQLLLGAATFTISATSTAAANIEFRMDEGAILSVNAGRTLTLSASDASSISQHFVGAGTVVLSSPVIHTRWFDSGTHNQTAIQGALDAIGDTTPIIRSNHIAVDDLLTLTATVVVNKKAVLIDCGGISAFSATSPPAKGFLWNGSGGGADPMIEIKNVIQGATIQNCRFYGNTANKPRSAISLVDQPGIGQSNVLIDNVFIGALSGDTGYTSVSFTDGIRIGDTYDSGINGNNDVITIRNSNVLGATGACVRLGGTQNVLNYIETTQLRSCAYGLRNAGGVDLKSVFFGGNSTSDIYVPLNDDYSSTVGAHVVGIDVSSEGSNRFVLLEGDTQLTIIGGYWQASSTTNVDTKIILGSSATNILTHLITLRQYRITNAAGAPASWKVSLPTNPGGGRHSTQIDLELEAYVMPIIDMDSDNSLDVHYACVGRTSPSYTVTLPTSPAQNIRSCNVLIGSGDTFDYHRHDIAANIVRVGERNNGYGVIAVSTTSQVVSTASGTSVTMTAGFPANSIVLGVTTRNITSVLCGGGCTAIRIGTVANPTKWNASLTQGVTPTTTIADWNLAIVGASPYYIQTAEDIVVSVNAGNFTGGSILITTSYIQLTPPVSP